MVKLEDAVIARFSVHGMTFEALVDPELSSALRAGKDVDIREVLAIDKIFKDARKGAAASEEAMLKAFNTTDVFEIAKEIICRGEVQVTTEQRRRMREERLKQLVDLISRRAINPRTGSPHPPYRVESAIKEAGLQIDEFKSAEEQLPVIVKALQEILPLRFEVRRIAVKIPPAHAGRAQGAVRNFGSVKQEEWLSDGSWAFIIEIPAGVQGEFFDKLNELTKGEVQTRAL